MDQANADPVRKSMRGCAEEPYPERKTMDIEKELENLGLRPKSWPEVSDAIRERLGRPDWETFSGLHRNFTGYRSESTHARFYGFVFSRGLQLELNMFRHARLRTVLEGLAGEVTPGISILDIGAGAGIPAAVLLRTRSPERYVVQDHCAEAREALHAQGFSVLPHPPPFPPDGAGFDLLLCIDSLGEINSDDDGRMHEPDTLDAALLPGLLEERYGFARKLGEWKPYLAPGGRVLLWEPFTHQAIWEALAVLLDESGWSTRLAGDAPGRAYLEIKPK